MKCKALTRAIFAPKLNVLLKREIWQAEERIQHRTTSVIFWHKGSSCARRPPPARHAAPSPAPGRAAERRCSRTALRCGAGPAGSARRMGPGGGDAVGAVTAQSPPRVQWRRSPARLGPPRRVRGAAAMGLLAVWGPAGRLRASSFSSSSPPPPASRGPGSSGRRWVGLGEGPVRFRSVPGRRCAAHGVAPQSRACPAGRGVDGAPARYVRAARTGSGRRSASRSRGRERDRGWGGRSVGLRGARREGEAGRQRPAAVGSRQRREEVSSRGRVWRCALQVSLERCVGPVGRLSVGSVLPHWWATAAGTSYGAGAGVVVTREAWRRCAGWRGAASPCFRWEAAGL